MQSHFESKQLSNTSRDSPRRASKRVHMSEPLSDEARDARRLRVKVWGYPGHGAQPSSQTIPNRHLCGGIGFRLTLAWLARTGLGAPFCLGSDSTAPPPKLLWVAPHRVHRRHGQQLQRQEHQQAQPLPGDTSGANTHSGPQITGVSPEKHFLPRLAQSHEPSVRCSRNRD